MLVLVLACTTDANDPLDQKHIEQGPVQPLPGDCGVIDDAAWADPAPRLFRQGFDLAEGFDPERMGEDAQAIAEVDNLGGSSVESEVLAMEVLDLCEEADLLATEAEIVYAFESKKTDILVEIDGRPVGVSVTRAYHWPEGEAYTPDEAVALLEHKLGDLPVAQAAAAPENAWERSLLHVLAYDEAHALTVAQAWSTLDPALHGSAWVFVTTTDGDDSAIY